MTVARAVIDLLPHEDLIYFGDTARCPYGPRAADEVRKFALEIMDVLVDEDVKLLVVACNSASSAALDDARSRYAVPIVDVIAPGVKAAVAATRNRRVGLIGTQRTVESGAYEKAMSATRANVSIHARACPRFVEFVERGDTSSDELLELAREYLQPLKDSDIDTLILGCTHYPLLSGVIQYVMGSGVVLISSAEAIAAEIFAELKDRGLLNRNRAMGAHRFVSSGEQGITSELGNRFLGPEFKDIEHRPWDKR